jgi:large subunit ribosomal protein L15
MDLSTVHHGVNKARPKKRVGRGIGSGHGKTSTRGHKGQWASAGAKKPAAVFEGGQMQLFRRIPKRGFSHATWDRTYHVVNVGALNDHFNDGDVVDPQKLADVGLAKGPADGVRILGEGELTRKLTVKAHHFSKSAAEKIASRGGTTEVIPGPKKPVRNKMKPRPPRPQSSS